MQPANMNHNARCEPSNSLVNWVRFLWLALFVLNIRGAYFEIQVVDAESGRGVPLVELEMVNHTKYLTDSAGRAAVNEPGLENETVFFYVRSHGYEFPKDGFGMAGARIKLAPGGREVLKIERLNIAERLYRNTGAGIYRDSILLGHKARIQEPLLNAKVMGQDSIQRVIYRGKIFWFWGDTLQVAYPLGNFRMSGATSELRSNPDQGVNLKYFVREDGFAKEMFPIEPKGDLNWADGFLVVPDSTGRERMIAHYIRLKGLGSRTLGRGLAAYNDEKNEFEELKKLDVEEKWRFPHGHPITTTNDSVRYFQFGQNAPNVRVPATYEALQDSGRYEAFTCIADGGSVKTNEVKLLRDG